MKHGSHVCVRTSYLLLYAPYRHEVGTAKHLAALSTEPLRAETMRAF